MTDNTTFDPSALERLRESVNGDAAFLAELVADYLEDASQHIKTLHHAIEQHDATLLERTAHSLKSTSKTMGAVALATICREIETLAHDGQIDEAASRVPEAARQFAAARDALQARQTTLQNEY